MKVQLTILGEFYPCGAPIKIAVSLSAHKKQLESG
jgi:hypothetical protein